MGSNSKWKGCGMNTFTRLWRQSEQACRVWRFIHSQTTGSIQTPLPPSPPFPPRSPTVCPLWTVSGIRLLGFGAGSFYVTAGLDCVNSPGVLAENLPRTEAINFQTGRAVIYNYVEAATLIPRLYTARLRRLITRWEDRRCLQVSQFGIMSLVIAVCLPGAAWCCLPSGVWWCLMLPSGVWWCLMLPSGVWWCLVLPA
ncbi:hypothetical protein RRG08_032178 [Elysia crispata]|uniref:Uncharacterized protein n=1 Tax=Elysia crispata TaxID=231223 RepID=A0AAE1DWA4_9GAST|nr:hypothetical protein RRG08_032178 [Elysia crispata]